MAGNFQKIKRLGMALGVVALVTGCASIPGETSPRGFSIRDGAPVAGTGGTAQMPALKVADTRVGRGVFGTVNPGARPGRRILSQHLIGQLPFGMQYAASDMRDAAWDKLGAARTTERRERWMDQVTANNNAYRSGRGQALMLGINPANPLEGARDMAQQYMRLAAMIDVRNPNRQQNAELLLQSYRDTIAARQDTAMLLQAEPRISHFQDYARLEAGRRVLGDVLVRGGVLVQDTVRQDAASTYGFLQGTEIGLVAYQGINNFGGDQVLLADDASQGPRGGIGDRNGTTIGGLNGATFAENISVQEVFRSVERDARRLQQIEAEAARRGISSAPPLQLGAGS